MDYLVKLLESLILAVNSSQDGLSHSLINKGAVDSLKDAGVFQALQENYPSVLGALSCIVFHSWPPLDIIEKLELMARFLKTQPET